MTRNQKRAIALAAGIRGGRVDPNHLPEIDWHLLLLAADMNRSSAPAGLIANRVLERAQRHVGYFAQTVPGAELAFSVHLKADLLVKNRKNSYTELGAALND